ncbi:MAG TPA: molybdopterin cofactor-binding domain-containing protein [Verrucomicrobiae bacterium]|nr:molybdopterin cofactor-binding domain-containing protein [Verrucomicrobiae bacterium]
MQVAAVREVAFTLNSQRVSSEVDDELMLLNLLRDKFDIVSPKNGCQPMGQCGCCAVMVDGKVVLSCVVKASTVAGRNVRTLEGLPAEERELLARAFVTTGGLQCGFCIPGIAMRAKWMLDQNPAMPREEIARWLGPHLCRCTGYTKIIDAVELAGQVRQGGAFPDLDESGRIGTSLMLYEGADKALGDKNYIDDLKVPGMVHGAFVFSEHPRAKVLKIDTSAAEQFPGVVKVITARDVPGEKCVGLIHRDWPVFIGQGEETHCVGDILAMVAAEDERTARRAAELIEVEYEVLKPVLTPEEALAPDAPLIHPHNPNKLCQASITRGDFAEAWKNAAHTVNVKVQTQPIEHAFLEPESCLAIPLGDGAVAARFGNLSGSQKSAALTAVAHGAHLVVYSQGQGVYDDRDQIADVLGLPHHKVYVELVSNGGAFGGKEDLAMQPHVALMARLTNRPCKATFRREESMRFHPKRHPIKFEYWAGCDKDGHLACVKVRAIGDKGAYASVGTKVLERSGGHACGPYRVPVVDIQSVGAYTNNPPCGAMRGFGANQAAFAIETVMDMLAEKVGIDGWEMRWRNALDVGDTFASGQVLRASVGLKKTLLAVKDVYRRAKFAGIACGIKNVGIGNGGEDGGRAMIGVDDDGTVVVRTGFTEMGQGLFTVLLQTFCEETGIHPRLVRLVTDTRYALDCGQTTGSRGTFLGCQAVRAACANFKPDMESVRSNGAMTRDDLKKLAGRKWYGEFIVNDTHPLGHTGPDVKTHITYGFATQVVILDDAGKLKKVVAAHDVGKVINPILLQGQIEGSIHMGLGYALTEELQLKDGHIASKDLRSLGILRAKDMPEVECIFIEENEPSGPYGAKGVGEIGLVPTAPAVAGALYKFDGIRRTKLPMKDSAAARAILGRK